ncbi:hypothetical protein IMSAGC019_00415 [Lachnospiraceae bacterium]|nr:hypothetical protein IMSAGC019_00415 [Lachnospiraceae bacterium]
MDCQPINTFPLAPGCGKYQKLRIAELDLCPFFSIFFFLRLFRQRFFHRLGLGLALGLFLFPAALFEELVQLVNKLLVFIGPFIGCFLDIAGVFLQGIQALEQGIYQVGLHLHGSVPDLRKNIFHVMGKVLHPFISHGSRHTFKGVCGTENFINSIHVLRFLFKL